MENLLTFKNLDDLTKYFKSESRCIKYFEQQRWLDGGRFCPHCASTHTYVCSGLGKYKCADCKERFSITTGTYFENTKLPLRKWLIAMYLCLTHSKGISSHQLGRTLGISQKSAWFVLHRIRGIVSEQAPQMLLTGIVEADETFIGGTDKNRHKDKRTHNYGDIKLTTKERKQNANTYTYADKKTVMGAVQRGGKVVAKYVPNATLTHIRPFIEKHIEKGSTLYTDEYYAYERLKNQFTHDSVNHSSKVYVKGNVHTNTIENFWSCVKRCVDGTYHQLSRKHLQKYLNEFCFRYNTRRDSNHQRFSEALSHCHGRLTYWDLIKKVKVS